MSQLEGERCPKCGGKGIVYMKNVDRPAMNKCEDCKGSGMKA